MPTTPHLALPLLAAAQAQKHVTHNEALASLDALVHLSVKERNRISPPAAPNDGDRYLVGDGAAGEFAGHANQVAWFDLATWRFLMPKAGWQAYVESERASLLFDGVTWMSGNDTPQVSRLGIGTAADALNPFAAKLNTALFTARQVAEGGSGDLRVVLNKESTPGVVSQIYQRAFSGRAETGLIGQDDFGIRVSPDGSQWRDAMRIDSRSGSVTFPGGLGSGLGLNLLINSHFLINQRGFSNGGLSSGIYGYDRWKGGTGGCTLTRLSDGTMSMTGGLDQVVDMAQAPALIGATHFGGCMLTFSIENVTGVLSVIIGGIAVALPEKPGRQSVTVTLDPTMTGHLTCRLQSTGAATFIRPKLELGSAATLWQGDWLENEETRCRRYYHRVFGSSTSLLAMPVTVHRRGTTFLEFPYVFSITMRANPTIVGSGFTWVTTQPTANQAGYLDTTSLTWLGPARGGTVLLAFGKTSPNGAIIRITSTTTFDGPAGGTGQLNLGASAFIAIQSEL